MSGHSSGEWLLLFVTALIVIVFVFYLVRRFWNYPLNHGPGFFLDVEVAPGFYNGEGVRWLKRYRTILLAEYLIEALALAAILVSGRWSLLPLWAGGTAVFATAIFFGFTAYTRATLGANPPVRTSAVVSLETRRLGDYISWPAEALMAVIIALCWALLLMHGDAQVQWNAPVVFTYVIVGLLPFKIGVVRNSYPLPSEKAEEHYRWADAQRRYWLRLMDCFFAGSSRPPCRVCPPTWLARGQPDCLASLAGHRHCDSRLAGGSGHTCPRKRTLGRDGP